MKICGHCNKEIMSPGPTQLYHTDCAKQVKYIRQRERDRSDKKEHLCKLCGTKFTKKHGSQKYCSEECASEYKNGAKYGEETLEQINVRIANKFLKMPVYKTTI